MPNLLILIPTFNERKNIITLIKQLESVHKEVSFDVLFIDDESPDRTYDIIKMQMKRKTWIKLIVRHRERGLGSALREGYKYALKNKYDYLIQMDADMQHPPKYIPQIYNMLKNNYDVVIASRYARGGGCINWPIYRHIISKMANLYAKILLKLDINDLTSGYRGFNKRALYYLERYNFRSKGFSLQVETLLHLKNKNLKICEVPFIFRSRIHGKSKLGLSEIIRYFTSIIKLSAKKL